MIMFTKFAKYHLGQVVRHKKHPFRGVVFDVDPEFNNSDEWYENLPEDGRPSKEQPFYHLLAENERIHLVSRLNILMYAIYLDPLRMDTILYIFILINGPLH